MIGKSLFTVALATYAVVAEDIVAVSEDGIWTGYDWIDTTNNFYDINGTLSGLSN